MNPSTTEQDADAVLMDPHAEFLTTREAAERLGVALRTAQLWVESGALPAWKTVGGHRRIPAAAVEAMRVSRVVTRLRPHTGEPYRILAVEDEPITLKLIHLMVTGWGLPLELQTATDGFEALPRIASWRPHLLVTDLLMPGMDGFRMLRSLHQNPECAALEIIVVTGMTPAEVDEKGGVPRGVQVWPKPVPFDRLEALVRERIGGRTDMQGTLASAA